MTISSFWPSPEFETLIELMCEDLLTPEQAERLEEIVTTDEEACWHYLCHVHVHGMLSWNTGQGASTRPAVAPPVAAPILPPLGEPLGESPPLTGRVWFAYAVAALSLAVSLVFAWFSIGHEPGLRPRALAKARGFDLAGKITGMVDCQWEDPATVVSHGDGVPLGKRYTLRSGLLEITYDTGAKVILQGPATYEADSGNSGFMLVGKMTGRVPTDAARGFTLRTPTATVVDMGTEFAVDVSNTGQTTSHVFQGQVKLLAFLSDLDSQGRELLLRANETCRVERRADDAGLVPLLHRVKAEPKQFVRSEDLAKKIKESQTRAFRNWQTFRDKLRSDPSLVAYFDFQRDPRRPGVLLNVAPQGNQTMDGVIQGAQWAEGRIPGKQALRFAGPTDFVKVNIPSNTGDLTVAGWVYIDSLCDPTSGLVMSDNWRQPGQVHWELSANGSLHCEIVGLRRLKASADGIALGTSSPAIDRRRLARWTHLATVYRQATKELTFYCDGAVQETIETAASSDTPISIGKARIGGWLNSSAGDKDRPFYGSIDELLVFRRPLEPTEIEQIYQAARPGDAK